MLFSMDYDKTWTADPKLFASFVGDLKSAGHKVVCITARSKDTSDKKLAKSIGKYMKIYFAGGRAKQQYAKEKGLSVDIWIDDNPDSCVNNEFQGFC